MFTRCLIAVSLLASQAAWGSSLAPDESLGRPIGYIVIRNWVNRPIRCRFRASTMHEVTIHPDQVWGEPVYRGHPVAISFADGLGGSVTRTLAPGAYRFTLSSPPTYFGYKVELYKDGTR
jgi:hypothetical protein